MKKAVLFLLSFAIISQAHAKKVVLYVGDQAVTEFSLVSLERNPKYPQVRDYRIAFNGSDSATLTTPELYYVQVTPKAIDDSRPMDGCLSLQLTNDLTLNECSNDGPTYWYLESKSTRKTIDLEVQVDGRLRVKRD